MFGHLPGQGHCKIRVQEGESQGVVAHRESLQSRVRQQEGSSLAAEPVHILQALTGLGSRYLGSWFMLRREIKPNSIQLRRVRKQQELARKEMQVFFLSFANKITLF